VNRRSAIRAIEEALGHGRLVWVGTRGTDAAPLLCIEQFAGVIGLIAPLGVPSWGDDGEHYLEQISGRRVDLNTYAVDSDSSEERRELGSRLRRALVQGTFVATYRPTGFLASAYFPRLEYATYLGMFHGAQSAFEHKPWVETQLARRGVPIIPWHYFADEDHEVMCEWVEGLSCVLRANYSDGGVGLTRYRPGEGVPSRQLLHDGGFLAVAPFLEHNTPLNLSGCVFPSGEITVRSPSMQLIGVPSCTNRAFGYCGNDFAAVYAALGDDGLDELEGIMRAVGGWLHERGYLGAFGIDAMQHDGRILLTEINPRFQGSSAAGTHVFAEADQPDIYLDHLCATLGLSTAECAPLREQGQLQANEGHRLAQVVCYNTGEALRARRDAVVPDVAYGDVKGTAESGIVVEPEAMLFKIFVHDSVTRSGFDIPNWLSSDIARLTNTLYEPEDGVAAADVAGQPVPHRQWRSRVRRSQL